MMQTRIRDGMVIRYDPEAELIYWGPYVADLVSHDVRPAPPAMRTQETATAVELMKLSVLAMDFHDDKPLLEPIE